MLWRLYELHVCHPINKISSFNIVGHWLSPNQTPTLESPYNFLLPLLQFTNFVRCCLSVVLHPCISQLQWPHIIRYLITTSCFEQGLPPFVICSKSDMYAIRVNISLSLRITCPNRFETFRSTVSIIFFSHTNSALHFFTPHFINPSHYTPST